jgi:hypothetical protein
MHDRVNLRHRAVGAQVSDLNLVLARALVIDA